MPTPTPPPSCPTLTSILQTPQAFPLQQILTDKPTYMQKLIDYISTLPDPFLMNDRQCYYYPSKAVEILNTIGVYKNVVKKEEKKSSVIDVTKGRFQEEEDDQEYEYPYLERLFGNLRMIENQEILLGYVDRVLFSITKKTPQIYEYFKDNQASLLLILNNDRILFALKEFLTLFLTESTMMLYVFLKNMVLRTLMFRIVEDESTGPVVYQMLGEFYSELLKAYVMQTGEEDREEVVEVLKNIEEENFIALLALKISPEHHRKTYFIAKMLNQIASSPNQVSELVTPYIDTYTQYLQTYQESPDFMLLIMPDQLMMLRLILRICSLQPTSLTDIKQQLIKRLLVYSNIHQKNSIIHTMLFTLIEILEEQGNARILIKAKIIEFLRNNLKQETGMNFRGLVGRVCAFYEGKGLDAELEEEAERAFVRGFKEERRKRLEGCRFFREKEVSNQSLVGFQANLSLVSDKGQGDNKDITQGNKEGNESKEGNETSAEGDK